MNRRPLRGLWVGLSGLATMTVAGLSATPASAQVIEVGPQGFVTRSGPAVTTSEGVTPITTQRRVASPSAAAQARLANATPLFTRAGKDVQLSPQLLEAVAYVESRFDPKAISPKGAIGLMQLAPGTARELGVDPHNPETNARGGASYLRQMLAMFDNNVELALAAYNAGPTAVTRYGGVPPYPETQAYVAAVLDYLARTASPEIK